MGKITELSENTAPLPTDLVAIAADPQGSPLTQKLQLGNLKQALGLTKTDVGLASVDNTSDASKPVSTAQQAALDAKANQSALASLTKADVGLGNVDNTSDAAKPISTAEQSALNLKADSTINSSYRLLLAANGSHIAARVAGTYAMGTGNPLAISGTGTLYALAVIQIVGADFPTINGITTKLRIRAQLFTNDVAPFTGTFTVGLFPITRPATSGGAGLCIFTLGTVVAGSNGAVFTNPPADGLLSATGADFAVPANGFYVIGVVTSATMAANSHTHINAQLQMRNV